MSRRSVALSALVATIAAGGLIPSFLTGAHAAACPAWTDPAGDATTAGIPDPSQDPVGVVRDQNMDIVASGITTTADNLTATIKVAKLNATASDAGDSFKFYFTVGGKALYLYSMRPGSVPVAGTIPTGSGTGIYNATSSTSFPDKVKATYDLKASTVTMSATVADVASAAGVPVTGAAMSAIKTTAADQVTISGRTVGALYDDSTTNLTPALGVACGAAGGGTPTPTASPTPTPSPTATTPPPGPSTGDPMKDLPKAGCSTATDPKSDGTVAGATQNDPDLDITALTMRSTATDLLAYVNVDKLAAGTATADGQRYAVDFTFNKHVFTMSASSSAHGSTAARDALATSGLVGHVIQLGVDAPSTTAVPPPTDRGLKTSGLKANYDLKNSRVVFSLPISDIEKYGSAPFTGPLTAVDAKSQVETNALSLSADTLTATAGWTVGDNKCFTVPTALKLAVVKKGKARTVNATLTAAGAGLAKQPLNVFVNGKKVATILTDASGKASYTKANPNQTVRVDFAGGTGYDASTATTKV